jgi:hypothetical protein
VLSVALQEAWPERDFTSGENITRTAIPFRIAELVYPTSSSTDRLVAFICFAVIASWDGMRTLLSLNFP